MTNKILITGSCGFISSNFIRKCFYHRLNYNIVGIDKIVEPNNLKNMYINKANKTYFADILDNHILDVIFNVEKPDIVIHTAESHDTKDCIDVNIKGTQNIVEKCIKYNVKKILYLSTTEVYGWENCEFEKENSLEETSQCHPNSLFATTKLSGEDIVRVSGMQYYIVRCSNAFGPRQNSKEFIPNVIKNILHNEKNILNANGKRICDWIYVDDIVECLIYLLNQWSCDNGTYNISSNSEFADIETAHEICKFFGKGHDLITFCDQPDQYKLAPNIDKIKNTGWKPKYKFKDMIPQVCEWYQNNQWFFKT